MRIAIDSGSEVGGTPSGMGIVASEQIKALQTQAKKFKNFQVDVFDFSKNRQSLEKGKYDVVHYPYFHPFFVTLPKQKYAKVVVTIHDLIPLIYPKQFPSGIKGKIRFLIQKRLLKNVDAVITVSETSKKDIVRFLNIQAEKIYAIHNAPAPVFKKEYDRKKLNKVAQKYKLPNKFVFYLGDVYYNKNIPSLVKACEITNTPLVIVGKQIKDIDNNLATDLKKIKGPRDWLRFLVGKPHPELSHYRLLKEMFDKNKNIIRLGYVADEDLVPIMNLATVYCQPSLYEGFGLGVVHAFACGVPVIISKTQALVEISQGAALVSEPVDPMDLAAKIKILFENSSLRAELIRKGFDRLKYFSWEKTAKETIEVYKSVSKG